MAARRARGQAACYQVSSEVSRMRSVLYLLLAVAGLVITWGYNLSWIDAQQAAGAFRPLLAYVDFFLQASQHDIAASLGFDVVLTYLLCLPWVFVEARQRGMQRWFWIFLALGTFVALSTALGLFLFARERKLNAASV
jgi:hypothetical protein